MVKEKSGSIFWKKFGDFIYRFLREQGENRSSWGNTLGKKGDGGGGAL